MFDFIPWLLPVSMGLHNLRSRMARSLLTMLGITLGVAVVLAIDITNKSTLDSIQETFDRAVGKSELLVVPPSDQETMPGELLQRVQRTPGVKVASPGISVRTFLMGDSPGADARLGAKGVELGRLFEVQGIDPELDPQVRGYTLTAGRMPERQRYEAVIPEPLARDKDFDLGDDLVIVVPYGIERLKITGLLSDEGVGIINEGLVAFVPLNVVRDIFDRGDVLEEIAVQVETGIGSNPRALAALKDLLAERLSNEARSIYPAARGDLVPRMLNAYQMGLTFFSIIAIFVGAFLIYNTFSMTIAERTQEIGMLRSVGMSRWQVLGLVLTEAGILAILGALLGVAAGVLLARGLLVILGGFIRIDVTLISVTWQSVLTSVGIGFVVTLVAALLPAFQASRTSPLEALRVRSRTVQRIPSLVWVSGLVFLFVGWAGLYRLDWRPSVLIPAGSSSFILLLLGAVMTIPLIVRFLERGSRLMAIFLYRNEGALGSANVRRSVMRTTLTVACLLIALVMIIGIGTLSNTFKKDVQSWVNSALGGDLFVIVPDPLPESFARQLQDVPGVDVVSPTRFISVHIASASLTTGQDQKQELIFSAIYPDLFRQVGDMVFASGQGDSQQNWATLSRGEAIFISSVVADEYNLKQGDQLVLQTRRGEHPFTIAAVTTDFTGQGYVVTGSYVDLKRWFAESGADRFAITLTPGYRSEDAVREIKARFYNRHDLDIQTADTVKASVTSMLDQAFLLFDVLSLIGVVIGALGVTNTLTMNILERRREIGGLRSLGMTRGQIVRMVLAEALALGIMGSIYGLFFGFVISKVFVFTLTTLSSYEVNYLFTLQPYLISLLIAFGVSQVSAIGPARRAASINIVRAIMHE